jgi:hypothetical protein
MNQLTNRDIQISIISLLRQLQDVVNSDTEFEPRVIRLIAICNNAISPSLFATELMEFILNSVTIAEYIDYTRDTDNIEGFLYDVFSVMSDGGTTQREWIESIDYIHNSNIAYYLKLIINEIYIFSDLDSDSDSDYDSDMDSDIFFVEELLEYLDTPPIYQNSSNDELLDAGLPIYSEFSLSNVRIN